MKRLWVIPVILLLLTACSTSTPSPRMSVIYTPIMKPNNLLIGPNIRPTATRWLSPLSATAKAHYGDPRKITPLPPTPAPTATAGYHMPVNINSPTPAPKTANRSSGCRIKGNVSARNDNQKIYHCPGWRDYDRTEVNPGEGDRWFCSEAEAIAAGFRRPQNENSPCY